jgi:hypothetical protein
LSTQRETRRASSLYETALRFINVFRLKNRPPPDPISGDYQPVESEGTGTPLYLSREILEQLERGNPMPQLNADTFKGLAQALEAPFNDGGVDDKLHVFENLLHMLARMDPEHSFVKKQNNHAIALCKSDIVREL